MLDTNNRSFEATFLLVQRVTKEATKCHQKNYHYQPKNGQAEVVPTLKKSVGYKLIHAFTLNVY